MEQQLASSRAATQDHGFRFLQLSRKSLLVGKLPPMLAHWGIEQLVLSLPLHGSTRLAFDAVAILDSGMRSFPCARVGREDLGGQVVVNAAVWFPADRHSAGRWEDESDRRYAHKPADEKPLLQPLLQTTALEAIRVRDWVSALR